MDELTTNAAQSQERDESPLVLPVPSTTPTLPGWWIVIVAYNDQPLVARCVGSYRLQTRAPDVILVVDNSDVALRPEDMPPGTVLISSTAGNRRNTGSAGGFAAGMEYAFGHGAAVVVLSDQDYLPTPTVLEELSLMHVAHPSAVVSALTIDPTTQEVMPSWVTRPRSSEFGKQASAGTEELWLAPNRHELLSALGFDATGVRFQTAHQLRNYASGLGYKFARTPLASPHGLLIPRQVFERAGTFRRSFFIGLDDHEYSARLLDLDVPILVCLDAVGHHHLRWNHDRRVFGRPVKVFYGSASSMRWAIQNSLTMAIERAHGGLRVRWIMHDAYRSLIFVLRGDGSVRSRAFFVAKGWIAAIRYAWRRNSAAL